MRCSVSFSLIMKPVELKNCQCRIYLNRRLALRCGCVMVAFWSQWEYVLVVYDRKKFCGDHRRKSEVFLVLKKSARSVGLYGVGMLPVPSSRSFRL
jgi:hypothetical protein